KSKGRTERDSFSDSNKRIDANGAINHFGQLSVSICCELEFCNCVELGYLMADRSILSDSLDKEHTGNKLGKVSPKFTRMAEAIYCYRNLTAFTGHSMEFVSAVL